MLKAGVISNVLHAAYNILTRCVEAHGSDGAGNEEIIVLVISTVSHYTLRL